MAEHNCPRIAVIIVTVFVYIVMIAFNALSGAGGQALGIFNSTVGDVSDIFYLEVTPAGWTFSIWGFIYTWQALWLIYALTTICRKTKSGTYIYQLPVLPPIIYVLYIFNNICLVSWLFVWDRKELIWALVTIALLPITLAIALFFSFRRLYHNLEELTEDEAVRDIWLIRFLVQNGMAFFGAWVTIATLLNAAMVMTYRGNLTNEDACTTALGILSCIIVTWFLLDNTILDRYVRYTFSPYITLTIGLSGAVAKNYDIQLHYRNSIFLLTLLVVAAVMLITKFHIMIFRHFRKPISSKMQYNMNAEI
ncbi:uncharacterized protein LOC132550078 [Ylistrum balloti]|uniref:uncharacterized protein LOC132550078 n=1 Tax=Ylistrum balloti TaxID=509963 RepID=UPI002905E73B|nr:uncharacterized protein LOC132550078 [Ylistrum balloti]XP_060070071.1 uncharacterized protein LOC132550078 [Ylistrum balloti]